ncbi:MAG: hypothetical protein AAGA27_00275 [Pseudomonadota bacterium]
MKSIQKRLIAFFFYNVIALIAMIAFIRPASAFSLWADYGIGGISGFQQIPRGGQPGSSSPNRPTFSELGVKNPGLLEAGASGGFLLFRLDAIYQRLFLNGSATLSQSLVTHGIPFEAGTHVKTNSYYALTHLIASVTALHGQKFSLRPGVGLELMNFNYKISSDTQSTSRGFSHLAPELKVNFDYNLSAYLQWRSAVHVTVPGLTRLDNYEANTGIAYFPVTKSFPGIQPAIYIKTGYLYLNFKDKQTMPNHMRITYAPFVAGGLALYF